LTTSLRTSRGFTLLEVMVSIGILGVALLALGDLNGGAVRMHAYGKRLTVATQLARGKVLDLKEQLRKDGLSDYSKEYHGAFDDEGHPEFKWKAVVVKPEVDVEPEQLLSAVSGGLGLDNPNSPQAAMNPLAPGGPLAGLIQGQVKSMVELLKTSVREVKLTVSWPGARGASESFDLAEHIVVLPGAQQNAAANAAPMGAGVGGTSAGPGSPQGMPGMTGGPRAPGLTLPGGRP
jgi:general secretion pathway protein I